MKKQFAMMLALCALMSFTACGTGASEGAASSQTAAEQTSAQTASGEEIANPFQDCKTMEEAEKLAGFDMTVPEQVDGYPDQTIQAVANEMIQVICANGDSDVTIRKAAGSDDISGDYNEYAETNTVTVGERSVTLRGNHGTVSVAAWTDGGYTYAIDVSGAGLNQDTVTELVKDVT